MFAHNKYRVIYLTCVAVLLYLIKWWYSHASLEQMQWIMLPLAKLLGIFLPGSFELQVSGEWLHADLGIILVKGCSGMSFFMMSFAAYAFVFFVQQSQVSKEILFNSAKITVYAIAAAWLTTLIVNVLRVLLAMSFISNPVLVDWTGLSDESLHRLAGLLVYFSALFLQMRIATIINEKEAYLTSAVIMVAMLIFIPLLTGNAFNDLEKFTRHCVTLISFISLFGLSLTLIMGKKLRTQRTINPLEGAEEWAEQWAERTAH